MTGMDPKRRWGKNLELIDKRGSVDDAFNLRLKPGASDDDKADFETYVMDEMGGSYFLKEDYPDMKDPYYTWEGKVVERASLEGRKIPLAEVVDDEW